MKHCGSKSIKIDSEIKPLVIELNRRGYVTDGSCAGHGYRGSISFRSKGLGPHGYTYLTKDEAKDVVLIARGYGCKRIDFPPDVNANGKVFAMMFFSSMGKK